MHVDITFESKGYEGTQSSVPSRGNMDLHLRWRWRYCRHCWHGKQILRGSWVKVNVWHLKEPTQWSWLKIKHKDCGGMVMKTVKSNDF